jgi:prepilin-type N-terminal cleavage/methylation domain-containing protein
MQALRAKKQTINASSRGFTLLELLAALVIIGFLVTIVSNRVQGLGDDACVIAALNGMKTVSAAAREFHCDFGVIPEEIVRVKKQDDSVNDKRNQNPEYASRFLGLDKDCSDETLRAYMEDGTFDYPDLLEDGHAGCYDMALCLQDLLGMTTKRSVLELLLHDWRGNYVRSNAMFNATELDPDAYPADPDGNPVYLPVIATPWADAIESEALEAAKKGKTELAQEFRRGKYYQIRVDSKIECIRRGVSGACAESKWKQLKDTARIVCLGENGLDDGGTRYPVPEDIGDDMVMFVFGSAPVRSPLGI